MRKHELIRQYDGLKNAFDHQEWYHLGQLLEIFINHILKEDKGMICPFCEEGDFDREGLDIHIKIYCEGSKTGAKGSGAISVQQPAARLTSPALDNVDSQACSTQTAETKD
jgi:hypothetical protein